MRLLKIGKIGLVVMLMCLLGCTGYSTIRRPESANIINAPIDAVWEEALKLLPTERMTITFSNKDEYEIVAEKAMTFWGLGDIVRIILHPKSEKQTLVEMSAQKRMGLLDYGHEGRMVRSIFTKLRTLCEK